MRPGLFEGAWTRGERKGGGGGAECAADYNSKTIYGVEMKFGKVVENQKLINSGVI